MNWEYKTIYSNKRTFLSGTVKTVELNEQLNELGREGWELVNISAYGVGRGILIVLKRQHVN
jgi:hypothetical protein